MGVDSCKWLFDGKQIWQKVLMILTMALDDLR